uniref:Uncharacterized protein n=1 Tax=Steinernema glaseri TaxID=37863 RepID=A0A1I7Y285_9BILA
MIDGERSTFHVPLLFSFRFQSQVESFKSESFKPKRSKNAKLGGRAKAALLDSSVVCFFSKHEADSGPGSKYSRGCSPERWRFRNASDLGLGVHRSNYSAAPPCSLRVIRARDTPRNVAFTVFAFRDGQLVAPRGERPLLLRLLHLLPVGQPRLLALSLAADAQAMRLRTRRQQSPHGLRHPGQRDDPEARDPLRRHHRGLHRPHREGERLDQRCRR